MIPEDPQWWVPPPRLERTDALEPGPAGRRACTECGEMVDAETGEALAPLSAERE